MSRQGATPGGSMHLPNRQRTSCCSQQRCFVRWPPWSVTVEDQVSGHRVRPIRVYYPMLVFDGMEKTGIEMEGGAVSLELGGRGVRFSVLDPPNAILRRTSTTLRHRDGLIEPAVAKIAGRRAVYRITAK